MKKFLIVSALAFLLGGCMCAAPQNRSALDEAKELVRSGQAECVLVKDGKIIDRERGRGVSPLLVLYERRQADMNGAEIVDKVIGRAAAAIAICGKAGRVHGEIMSEDAVDFLRKNGIATSHTLLVPRILNRKRDGLCPLEQSVQGIDDPKTALAALRKKIRSFAEKPPLEN